ncbi:hypothetical protein [Actinospica robiniae]|uniref:hypothetical protein n=1 Tax=Actinospica robiniae TaxID=304901 RepID=UPI00041A50A4|nr:hypothetical protein [Actinospica robiniae]
MVSLIIGAAVLALLIFRQVSVRPLREGHRVPLILTVVGIVEFSQYLRSHRGHPAAIASALGGSLVLAAVSGAARAPTVRIWTQDGTVMRQGTALTVLLWIVPAAMHLGYDKLAGGNAVGDVGASTMLLYYAVTFTVQRRVLHARARAH